MKRALPLVILASLAACSRQETAAGTAGGEGNANGATARGVSSDAAAPGTTARAVTLLVTANENGHLLPSEEAKSGAAELLGQWVATEKHCAGPLGASGAPACPEDATLVLSAGDHWTGEALSAYFNGEPTADAMAQMGYAVSALGNHEFDFGREAFARNAEKAHLVHLGANVKVNAATKPGVQLAPFQVFERGGTKVGVVALASEKTVKSAMAGRMEGIEVRPYEEALAEALPAARTAGAAAIVVLAHECPLTLAPVVAQHADWKVALVAGACRTQQNETRGGTTYASAGQKFDGYLRARLTAQGDGVSVKAEHVRVGNTAPDPALAKALGVWKQKLDASLGEEIGFSATGIEAPADVGKWAATALREATGAEVAVLNKKGVRGALPKGKLTRASVYGALPYENSVMLLKVKGSDLAKVTGNAEAIVAGAPKAVDAARTYTVATLDYLYFGGDGFDMEKVDPEPRETGMVWQTAVIDWTKKKNTSPAAPLERAMSAMR